VADNPYYRWFPSDWLGGMTRLRLTGSQTGTYRDLIDRMCDGPDADGWFPYSIDEAATLLATGLRPVDELRADISRLVEVGCIGQDKRGLYNKRAVKECARRKAVSGKRKAAANARWGAEQEESKVDANAMQMHPVCNAPLESIGLESKVVESKASKATASPSSTHARISLLDDNALVEIQQDWNGTIACEVGMHCSRITSKRRSRLQESATEYDDLRTAEGWRAYFDQVKRNDVLMGRVDWYNGKKFDRLSLEFVAAPETVTKVREGFYKAKLTGWEDV